MNIVNEKRSLIDFNFGNSKRTKNLILCLNKKRRNLFFSITDLNGKLLSCLSAGSFKVKRKKRMSPQIIELMVKRMLNKIEFLGKFLKFFIVLKLKNYFIISTVVRMLYKFNFKIISFVDKIPIPHNGCKLKKIRRL